MKNELLH